MKHLPTSGAEPTYNPKKWNKKYYKHSHNCYEYSLDDYDHKDPNICRKHEKKENKIYKDEKKLNKFFNPLKLKSQPGFLRGYKKIKDRKHFNCPEMVKRTLSDNKESV